MIERFLKRPRVQQRLERSPLASVVEAFVAHLDGRGYSKTTVQAYLQAAAHFALCEQHHEDGGLWRLF
jgi:hypothetical protein